MIGEVVTNYRVVSLIGLLSVVGVAGAARADGRDPRELEAKKACLGGRPDKGIELLADLYAETGDLTYIYNQGRCYQQNGRASEAITRFKEYLRKSPNLEAGERARVQGHIAEMEEQLRSTAQLSTPPSSLPPPSVSSSSSPAGTAGVPGSGRSMRIGGITVSAAGALALVGAVYMGVHAQALFDEAERKYSAPSGNQCQGAAADHCRGLFADAESAVTWQWIGYGAGTAALIGGAALYWLGRERDASHKPTVEVTPQVSLNGAGGSIRMTF